ncbi:response regulator [Aeromonas rivipollensis]
MEVDPVGTLFIPAMSASPGYKEVDAMRLLLVEDEEKTSSYLCRALGESGFMVDVSAEGAEGLHFSLEYEYDAIILDVMLPGMDGYRVLEGLRASKQTPVLMLSARGSVDERVKGLRLGADDYLPKPFSLIELVARIQALVRRRGSMGQTSPNCRSTICTWICWRVGCRAPVIGWNSPPRSFPCSVCWLVIRERSSRR